MSLQVWMPLDGDIHNQGLNNGTTDKGTYISFTNGKIGQCATSSASNNTIRLTSAEFPAMFANGKTYTLTCWIKLTGTASEGWIVKLGSNTCGLWWAKSVARLVWNENDNGKRLASTPIADDYTNWHHVASVIDKTVSGKITAKHYIDGVLSTEIGTSTWDCSSHSQPAGNYIDIYPYNALINDVRIYDHALSPREVAEIAKGLVLHYPLNRRGFGQDNLLKNSATNFPQSWGGSGDGRSRTTVSGVSVPEWGCNDALRVYGQSGASNALCLLINDGSHGFTVSYTSVSGQKYVPSIYVKNNHSTNAINIAFNGLSSSVPVNAGECKKVVLDATGDGSHSLQFTILASGVSKEYDFTFWHPKVELGEISTPWIPATTDSLYSAMGLNGTTEYDVSGFGYNGTGTSISYSSDTPKYGVSVLLNTNTSYIQRAFSIGNIWSVSCWAKKNSVGVCFIFQVGNGGSYANTQFGMHTSSDDGSIATICNTQYKTASLTSYMNWNHYCMTYDGSSLKTYINGELKWTSSNTTEQINSDKLSIGCYYNKNNVFDGNISDFRIYSTVLSASDVLELYEGGRLT